MLLCDVFANKATSIYSKNIYKTVSSKIYLRNAVVGPNHAVVLPCMRVAASLITCSCFQCLNCLQAWKKCTKLMQTVLHAFVPRCLLYLNMHLLIHDFFLPAHGASLSRFVCIHANDDIGRVEVGDRCVQLSYMCHPANQIRLAK